MLPAFVALSLLFSQNVPMGNTPSAPAGPIEPAAALLIQPPGSGSFVLHGTIPVPPGTYLPGGPRPLQIVHPNGEIIEDTQIEVVSRYPDPADGADVVELIARVDPDPRWKDNEHNTYDVLHLERGTTPDPGTPDVFDLIEGPKHVPFPIQGLIADPESILVVAHDPLGTTYVARPLLGQQGMKTCRYGPYMSTLRTYEILKSDDPSSLPPGSYPHMMGVHSYLTTVSEEGALLLDLRFNNGADDFTINPLDDSLGKIYFHSIEVYVEKVWAQWWVRQQFEDPFSFHSKLDSPVTKTYGGRTYWAFPIVKPVPLAQNAVHMMPCKAQFIRRMVISPVESKDDAFALLNQAGIGFAAKRFNQTGGQYWSWWNRETARYFPQRYPLAALGFGNANYGGKPDLRATLTRWFRECRDALENSTVFLLPENRGSYTQLGWARPLGVPDGGATGGLGIQFVDGDRTAGVASADGYRFLQIRHRLHGDRMPNVVRDLKGEPTTQESWLIKCPTCDPLVFPNGSTGTPSWTRVVHDMNKGSFDADFCPTTSGWAPNLHVAQNGLMPNYETNPDNFYNLTAYQPHNTYHHIRYTRLPMALAWLGNDPVARDDVHAQAEMFRLTYTEYPSQSGSAYAASMAADKQYVLAKPRWGYHTGRGEGWGITCMNAAYAMADDAWRVSMRPWFARIVGTLDLGLARKNDPAYLSLSTGLAYDWGIINAHQSNKLYGVLPADPRGRQPWEEMIVQAGMRGMMKSVFTDADTQMATLTDLVSRSYYGLLAPVSWNENGKHIWETMPVSDSTYTGINAIYDCDPTLVNCSGQNPQPGGTYAPKWRDDHYNWPSMADALELTGDSLFSRRSYRMISGNSCVTDCRKQIQISLQWQGDPTWELDYSEWSNRSVLLGRVQ